MNRPTDGRGHPGAPSLEIVRDGRRRGSQDSLPTRAAARREEQAERAEGAERASASHGGTDLVPQPSREEALRAQLRERTADLQRVKAEYDNYRKRVRRDRLAVREIAVANVLGRLLPVLDALAEADEQGEVEGGFERVAEVLRSEVAALGLEPFGTAGEPFDPFVHEAVSYSYSDTLERPICTEILRPGHRVGDHLLRPAQVAVAGPPTGP
ncbi:nucleotide exchange factor GrpE [Streptomyces sp. ISL-100]|uniref:nucleotide exchange factor GrpE n=1 Tax=Streptomyces sp. ISL-100 TaxID=2819173 RepID=UPI001BE5BD32|nr:nucleotide exchange factor GrpE [Streptomyces sp. ISL-100]MBT2396684.1 nucleotide exchange factor GrpE [Streptomyces sp. ISL-100]